MTPETHYCSFIDYRGQGFQTRGRGGFRGRGNFSGQPFGREEVEHERPQLVKPWEVNPEFVPKGNYYFEVKLLSANLKAAEVSFKSGCSNQAKRDRSPLI